MSLTDFVRRPNIRKAFDALATKQRTPAEFKRTPLLIEDVGGPRGLTGTAFDYLARLHIARVLRNSDVKLVRREWVSEFVQARLTPNNAGDGMVFDVGYNERWQRDLTEAHSLAYEYIHGGGSLQWLALMVQYLAHADLLTRSLMGFDSNFDAHGRVARELTDIMGYFDPVELFKPGKTVFLNPQFAFHEYIGGADADLIVDDTLIEFKATTKLSVTKNYLLQLAGYAALNKLGGVEMPESKVTTPHIRNLGIYFPRHNKYVKIPIAELFPDCGFDEFCSVFESEFGIAKKKYKENQHKIDEMLTKYEKRRNIIRPCNEFA